MDTLAPVLGREHSLPVPETSPRRRTEIRVPPVGYEQAPPQPGWPALHTASHTAPHPAPLPAPEPARSESRGKPLRGDLRERLAPVMGPGVHGVRIHDDEHAVRIAAAYGTDAVTLGQDIFLASREPTRPEDLALLAHEVWHATEPGRAAGAPHRATMMGAAEEEQAALAVEHTFLVGTTGTPQAPPTAPIPAAAPSSMMPALSSPPPAPSGQLGTASNTSAARPMFARPDRRAEPPSQVMDPGALRDAVREVLRGELRDQAARQLRADIAIELERGA
ncbi:DUF4157 domain-containing protein [Streptomyces lydicus]|uniref:DUF4157 domain-containing protein n=1 Tax=Streptomyces lydicus TaxID=47763 RepID=UPI0037A37F3F